MSKTRIKTRLDRLRAKRLEQQRLEQLLPKYGKIYITVSPDDWPDPPEKNLHNDEKENEK